MLCIIVYNHTSIHELSLRYMENVCMTTHEECVAHNDVRTG